MLIIATILVYFACLYAFSLFTSRHADNADFFSARRQSPWYMVAFGMIGASVSGVTFVSVPGMVLTSAMTYLQMCMGFIVGYAVVAFVLLPVYYRLHLTTIYTYLRTRFGRNAYKTGAAFFIISKLIGAALKFYVVCMILQRFVFDRWHVPFLLTVVALVMLIWLYTRRGGIRTLVWTDSFQTLCIFVALVLIITQVMSALYLSFGQAFGAVMSSPLSRVFEWHDWASPQLFWKQFLSGIFVVVVMTGLDQDMMQKNLTCRTLHEAQKDMCSYGLAFLPANMLFLALGVLLTMLATQRGMVLPEKSDDLMLMFTAGGQLGPLVTVLFTIGIVAACFSSADSALTSLTTSFCVDVCERADSVGLRKRVHLSMSVVFILLILGVHVAGTGTLITAVYTLVGYTYGPLLGLFAFGLFTRWRVHDRFVPIVAIVPPFLCYALSAIAESSFGYHFGYELLMLNGILAFLGLCLVRSKN